jgi:hypothetical protein
MTALAMPARAELRTGRRARDAPGRAGAAAGYKLTARDSLPVSVQRAMPDGLPAGTRPTPALARSARAPRQAPSNTTSASRYSGVRVCSHAQAISPAVGVNASCSSRTGTARLNPGYAVRSIDAKSHHLAINPGKTPYRRKL